MIGQRFNSLTVIERHGSDKHSHPLWLSSCDCGGSKISTKSDLSSGRVKSCGCLNTIFKKGDKNPHWKGGKKKLICAYCGKEFEKYESMTTSYEFNYCGNECRHKHYAERVTGKNNPRYKEKIKVSCSFCGSALEILPCKDSLYGNHFCNRSCHAKWKSLNDTLHNNSNWKGGKSFEPYPLAWSHKLREAIRDRDGRVCQVCGKAENGERLAVHHIDYCKGNIDPENLISLCHECHSKTNANRDEWQEFFTQQKLTPLTGTNNLEV